MMVGRKHKRDRYSPPFPEALPQEFIILTNYMLISWWLKRLDGIVNCIILLGLMDQILVMTKKRTTLGYTYATCRLKSLYTLLAFSRYSPILWIPEGGTVRQDILCNYLESTLKNPQPHFIFQQDINFRTQGALTPSNLTLTSTLSTIP